MRFSWSSRVFGCMCWLYCENAIAWNHLHMTWHITLCSFMCMDWFSLPGWPQTRGKSWFWVALGSPSLHVWLKTERTERFNSVPVHTLGFTTVLTGTHSHFRADRENKEARYKLKRKGGEKQREIKRLKKKLGRERKQGLPSWTLHRHVDVGSAAITYLVKQKQLSQARIQVHNWLAADDNQMTN